MIAVGGHARNVGKTSVVAGLISALPQFEWTAMKVTSGDRSLTPGQAYAVIQEQNPGVGDTGRFLAAGARRAYWVRAAEGELGQALPAVRAVKADSRNLIVESDSIVEILTPDLYLVVLDFAQQDFKASSRRWLARADACVVIERDLRQPLWRDVAREDWEGKPRFTVRPPQYAMAALAAFVNERLLTAGASGGAGVSE
jgi:hypothetical protein